MAVTSNVVLCMVAASAAVLPIAAMQAGSVPEQPDGTSYLARRGRRGLLSEVSQYPMGRQSLQWIQEKAESISLEQVGYNGTKQVTGIVTHAGKHALDYIDSSVMLGLALQKYVPEYPRFAIVIQGMAEEFKRQLSRAGWYLVEVEDWGNEHCGGNCAQNFLGRWGDSFEKINVWRIPLDRVLFLDSDTYVFSDKIRDILDMQLGSNQIAMAPDGCKPEHNSGMLLFRPDVGVFANLMQEIARHSGGREVLDQTIINLEYEGNIVTMDKKYNCVDYSGDKHCILDCGDDTVIAHFTGSPKPTREGLRNVERVRSLNGSSFCQGTNLGCCKLWPRYYCDMKANTEHMSKLLRRSLQQAGPCLVEQL